MKKAHICIFISLLIIWPTMLLAVTEHQLKAAYLYNITKFIQWPENAFQSKNDPIRLCIIGKHFFENSLKPLEKKSVASRNFELFYFENSSKATNCHISYLSTSQKNILQEELSLLESKSMMTISDIHAFAEQGGMIELRKQKNKIRMYINLQALSIKNLYLSSKLLELSTIVEDQK